jgi:uncharacterized protein (TIGR03000 family)
MYRNWLGAIAAPVLAIAALTFAGGPALAAHGGGGHGHGGSFHGSGFGGGGWHGGGWHAYGYHRGFYGNFGYPWYGIGWGGYGYPYSYGYHPYTDYTYPYTSSSVPVTTEYSSFYSPSAEAAQTSDQNVQLNVQVPPDAKVWIDGYQTKETGALRHYVSPPLTPGKNYSYELRASWTANGQPVDRTRRVTVHAGDVINLNMMSSASQ